MKALSVITCLLIFLQANGEQVLNVKDFGAKGNGFTDDTRAIQHAINSASPTTTVSIFFPPGIYRIASWTKTANYLENYVFLLHNNIHIKGVGNKTIIRLADHIFDVKDTSANAHLFYGINVSDISFNNLMIDLNGGNNLVPQHVIKNHSAIFIMGGSHIDIQKITIKNCAGSNMIVIREYGQHALVADCKFYNGGNYVGVPTPNKGQTDFSFIYCTWNNSTIKNNLIEQKRPDIALSNYSGGIELHGSFSTASENTITGCFPAFYISSDMDSIREVRVENNRITECLTGISFWLVHPMNKITITGNTIALTYPRLLKPGLIAGIIVPNGNAAAYNSKLANAAALSNIVIANNSITSDLPDSSNEKTVGMILHSVHYSTVENNIISGMNYAGILLMGSKWGIDKLSIVGNKFSDFRLNNDSTAVAGYIVATDTYSPSVKNAAGVKNISIDNNNFFRTGIAREIALNRKNKRGTFLGAFIALPASTLNEVKFSNNVFSQADEKIVSVKTD